MRVPFSGNNGPVPLPSNSGSAASFGFPNAHGLVGDGIVVSGGTPVSVVNPGIGVGAPVGLGVTDIDMNNDGVFGGFEGDMSMRIGSDTVDVDRFVPNGVGIGISGDGLMDATDFGDGGIISVSTGPVIGGRGGGRGVGGVSFGSHMSLDGPGFAQLGLPVSRGGAASVSVGGFDGGFDGVDTFTSHFGSMAGPWRGGAFGLGGGGGGVGIGVSTSAGFGAIPVNVAPRILGPMPVAPARGLGFNTAGARFVGGFGGGKFKLRGSSGRTVISDADTAVVNTGMRGNVAISDADTAIVSGRMGGRTTISDADTVFVNRGGPGKTIISDADTAIVNTGFLGPVRPLNFRRSRVPVRIMRRPMNAGFQFRGPARPIIPVRMPTRRPVVSVPRMPLVRPFIPRGISVRPMPRFTYRNSFGLGSFSRMSGIRSNMGRYNALRQIASAPARATYFGTGLVPGNEGYSAYYRNKFTPRLPVMRPQYVVPQMRLYGGSGYGRQMRKSTY